VQGLFITFEGIEGCGKTTQIGLLADFLAKSGRGVLLTREPGGTAIGESIRGIFLNSGNRELTPAAELLLVTAARVQHIEQVIMPALAAGTIVLCDRFCDATLAYQGYAGGVDLARIRQSHELYCRGLRPDLTLLLDCPVELGLSRSRARNSAAGIQQAEGRFEDKEIAFHDRVRQGYLALARQEPRRFHIVDGAAAIQQMQDEIRARVEELVRERGHAL
jgi:dTMP kinase